MTKPKIIVGLSGGVDSSVAAYLLMEAGYEVIGVTVKTYCAASDAFFDVSDAEKVANFLGIPYRTADFQEEFKSRVIDYFADEYFYGRTPNPCIRCNRYVKWEALFKEAALAGAKYVATGHYAQVVVNSHGRYTLASSSDKDQSYVLYLLTQSQLAHTLMPLAGYSKEDVRKIAKKAGLCTSEKPDSQEICFVPDGDYASFVQKHSGRSAEPGNFVDENLNILGRHKGIVHYTIGQRRGLGVSAGSRIFVKEIVAGDNNIVLGDNESLFSDTVRMKDISFMGAGSVSEGDRFFGKIRYNHAGEYCTVSSIEDNIITCTFDRPVRAAAPGQALVLYDSGMIVAGGTIV